MKSSTPPAMNRLIGRIRERSQLDEALSSGERIVSLVGFGGIGKSALLLDLLHRNTLEKRTIVFADLSTENTLEDLVTSLARAIQLPLNAADIHENIQELGAAFGAMGRSIVLMDSCEHCDAAIAQLIPQLLAEASGLQCVFASRHRIPLASFQVNVGPMLHEDSVQLFRTRASENTHETYAKDDTRIIEIVKQLEGIPLAIEIVASRASVFALDEMISRLVENQQWMFTTFGNRATSTNKTLLSTIEWSLSLLSETERSIFRQCAIFESGFSFEAAERVISTQGSVADCFRSLRNRSLLAVDESTRSKRFRIFQTVRQVLLSELTPSEIEELHNRHAQYYLACANHLLSAKSANSTPRMNSKELTATARIEFHNFIAAYRFFIDHDPTAAVRIILALEDYLSHSGPLSTFLQLLDTAIQRATPSLSITEQANLLRARGEVERTLGQLNLAQRDLEKAVLLARDASSTTVEAHALEELALLRNVQGRSPEAKEASQHALNIRQRAGNLAAEGTSRMMTASTYANAGNIMGAQKELEVAVDLLREAGDRNAEATALNQLATVLLHQGLVDQARWNMSEALRIAQEVEDTKNTAFAKNNFALLDHFLGNFKDATIHFVEAIQCFQQIGAARHLATTLVQKSVLHIETGLYDLARQDLRNALDLLKQGKTPRIEGLAITYLGAIEQMERNPEDAKAAFAAALDLLELAGEPGAIAVHRCFSCAKTPDKNVLSIEARIAERVASIERNSPTEASPPSVRPPLPQFVEVEPKYAWFRTSTTESIDMTRRRNLRLLLKKLIEHRLKMPGTPLSHAEILAVAWPGEKVIHRTGAARVYVAISTLRRLGLRDSLQGSGDGYYLHPNVSVRIVNNVHIDA